MRLLLALALLAVPAAALAGTRATYVDPDQKQLVILVADNGDARIEGATPDQYGLWQSGHFYLAARENGKWQVARVEDVAAAIDTVVPPVFKDIFAAGAAATPAKLRIERKGTRSVAGREGQVFLVYGLDEAKPEAPTEYVMSADPALKPVGTAMEQFMIATTVPMAVLIGPAAADMVVQVRAIFALGTPLDLAGQFRLVAVEPADVAHEAMELPAKPQTLNEIIAGMKVTPTEIDSGEEKPQPEE